MFKDFMILNMYIAQGQGEKTPKIWTVAKQFYFFNIRCKCQPLVFNTYCEK